MGQNPGEYFKGKLGSPPKYGQKHCGYRLHTSKNTALLGPYDANSLKIESKGYPLSLSRSHLQRSRGSQIPKPRERSTAVPLPPWQCRQTASQMPRLINIKLFDQFSWKYGIDHGAYSCQKPPKSLPVI